MLNLDKAGEEVSRIAGSTKSAESHFMAFGSELLLEGPQFIFSPALQAVQKVVAFLSSLGILPRLEVFMTNA